MAMAPSRGGVAFASPPYAPLNHGASLGERYSDLRYGHQEGEPAIGRYRTGTLNEEDLWNEGQERVNLGSDASVSGRPQRTQHRRDVQHVEMGNADRHGLPTIDETTRKAGGKVGPVSWGESLKYAAHSWCLGFWEALTVHRTVRIFVRSRPLLRRTAQCSLLNGFFFLGSILVLEGFLDPSLRCLLNLPRILDDALPAAPESESLATLHSFLILLYNMLWLYPIYIISFIINCMWHQDIAKRAYEALQGDQTLAAALGVEPRDLVKPTPPAAGKQGGSGMETLLNMIGEEVYRVVMFAVFVAQVYAVSLVPYVGLGLNFLLLSWLYAYYCFDYKWSSAGWTLDERLWFFETHWAFFAGFGTPCTIATFFLPFFASAAVWALVFPLFVLVATTSNPARVVSKSLGNDPHAVLKAQAWRVPIFRFASVQSVVLLKFMLPSSTNQQSMRN